MIGFQVLVGNTVQTRSEHFTFDLKSIILSELPKKEEVFKVLGVLLLRIKCNFRKSTKMDLVFGKQGPFSYGTIV